MVRRPTGRPARHVAKAGRRGEGAWAVAKPLSLYVGLRADEGAGLKMGRLPASPVSGRGGAGCAGSSCLGPNGGGLEPGMGVPQLTL